MQKLLTISQFNQIMITRMHSNTNFIC